MKTTQERIEITFQITQLAHGQRFSLDVKVEFYWDPTVVRPVDHYHCKSVRLRKHAVALDISIMKKTQLRIVVEK